MIFGEMILHEDTFDAAIPSGVWRNTIAFTYLAGTTVLVTPTLVASIPLGTSIVLCAGEEAVSMTELPLGVKTPVTFLSTTGGSDNLYVEIRFYSDRADKTTVPEVTSLAISIEQTTSLYTVATQVLVDGLTSVNGTWELDPELQKYLVPYSWITPRSHRQALSKIAEAAGGVAYQDRYGVVRMEAGNYIKRKATDVPLFDIGEDRILKANAPVTTVKNIVKAVSRPYEALASQLVWTLTGDKTISAGQTRTFDVRYSDYDAVIDAAASLSSAPAGASLTSATYYSWGATLEVLGSVNGQVLTLTINGKPLVVKGSQDVEVSDAASLRRNGPKALTVDENDLIQSADLALVIVQDILDVTKDETRDISIEWRGDPTIELGDVGDIMEYKGVVVTQEFNFNGALSANAQIRKV